MSLSPYCANCSHLIPDHAWNSPGETICPSCGERIIARVFPAFYAKSQATTPARIEAEGDASCFYHPANQAVVPCEVCGRFLCALCDLDLDGRHLCPNCLDRGIRVEKTAALETSRTQYDSMALHLVTWPVFTFWLPLVAAPIALFLVIRHWNTQMSILPRTRIRLVIALILACAEIGAVLALIGMLVWYLPSTRTGAT